MKRIRITIGQDTITLGYICRDRTTLAWCRVSKADAALHGMTNCLHVMHAALAKGHTPAMLVFPTGRCPVEAGYF